MLRVAGKREHLISPKSLLLNRRLLYLIGDSGHCGPVPVFEQQKLMTVDTKVISDDCTPFSQPELESPARLLREYLHLRPLLLLLGGRRPPDPLQPLRDRGHHCAGHSLNTTAVLTNECRWENFATLL